LSLWVFALLTQGDLGGPLFVFKGTSMTKKNSVNLLSGSTDFLQDGNNVIQKSTQIISQSFMDDLKESRNQTSGKPSGEFMRVASIPTTVVEKWMREGFNIWEASGTEIVKRLKNESLDGFLATDKRI
jgi:hypothetical protein